MTYESFPNLCYHRAGSEGTARARLRGQQKGTGMSEQRAKDVRQSMLQGEQGQQTAISAETFTN